MAAPVAASIRALMISCDIVDAKKPTNIITHAARSEPICANPLFLKIIRNKQCFGLGLSQKHEPILPMLPPTQKQPRHDDDCTANQGRKCGHIREKQIAKPDSPDHRGIFKRRNKTWRCATISFGKGEKADGRGNAKAADIYPIARRRHNPWPC